MGSIVLAGNYAVCYINGRIVGQVTSFRWTKRASVRRLQGIDQLTASELVRGPVVVAGQLTLVAVRRDGGAEGLGLTAPGPDLTREQYVSLMLKDRSSDGVLFRADQCLVDSEGWEVAPKSLMTASLSFEGISVSGAVRPRNVF